MKNYRFISIFKAVVFAMLVVIFFGIAYIIESSIFNSYGSEEGYIQKYPIENLEYSFDGKEFHDFDEFSQEDKFSKKNNMILRGEINCIDINNPVLYISTKNNYYEVYVDGEEVASREKINILSTFKAIDFVDISKEDNGKEVEVFLYANEVEEIGQHLDIYTANKMQVVTDIIINGIFGIMFSVFTFIAGILLLGSNISLRYRKYGFGIIGYLCILMSCVWLFSFNDLSVIYISNLYLISFLSSFAMFQVPIAVLLFTQQFDRKKKNKVKYKTAINTYIMFLLGMLILEIIDIVNIQQFTSHIAAVIIVINIISLFVFRGEIIRNKKNKNVDTKNREDVIAFERYIPIVFSIFLVLNIIGAFLYLISSEQIYYIVSITISTTILLIFCGILFSHDINSLNVIAVKDQERRELNATRINLLVEAQSNLFNETNIEDICKKFTNNITGVLFPYGDLKKSYKKLASDEVRKQYIEDYEFFVDECSAIVSVITNDIDNRNITSHKVFAATNEYAKYLGKDLQKEMNKEQYGKILFIMKGIKDPDPMDICVTIGDETSPKGVIVFKGAGNFENTLKGLLESYIRTCATLIENLKLIEETRSVQHDTVFNLNEISELRSKETGFHIKRVSLYSALIGKKIGYNEEELEILQLASSMHDIGKINVPDYVLNKPGKLTDEEFAVMKTHTEVGFDILKNTNNNIMKVGAIVAKYHHEKYNGKGYFGLVGEEIPKVARIVAVADVFDALSVSRVYKDPWPLEKILDLFKEERGQHFDSEIVDILFNNLDEFIEIRDKYREISE